MWAFALLALTGQIIEFDTRPRAVLTLDCQPPVYSTTQAPVQFAPIAPLPVAIPNRYQPATIIDPSMVMAPQPQVVPVETQLRFAYPQTYRMQGGQLMQRTCPNGRCRWSPAGMR